MSENKLDEILSSHPEPTPKIHPRGQSPLPEHDDPAPEDFDTLPANYSLNGWVVGLEYTDDYNEKTERVIRISGIRHQYDDYYIQAFCYSRQAPRSFIVGRVKSLWDSETGTIITENALKYFRDFIENTHERASILCAPYIRILSHMARIDGHFDKQEKDAIIDFCVQRILREDKLYEFDEERMRKKMNALYPGHGQFRRDVETLIHDPHLPIFRRAVLNLIEADGLTRDEEITLATSIHRYLLDTA